MDGVGTTYERIRGRSFEKLVQYLSLLKERIPFGINYVVNHNTIDDLSEAVSIVETCGTEEILLLPEEPIGLGQKIDSSTLEHLRTWIDNYKGNVRLAISSSYKGMINSLIALENEPDHLAFAHIDATGQLKPSSFSQNGYAIDNNGVLDAYARLYSEIED